MRFHLATWVGLLFLSPAMAETTDLSSFAPTETTSAEASTLQNSPSLNDDRFKVLKFIDELLADETREAQPYEPTDAAAHR